MATDGPLLSIRDLHVEFATKDGGTLPAVRGVDLDVGAGELVAVVGESGSGKSVTMLAVLGLLGPNATARGSVRFDGLELLGAPPAQLRRIRGRPHRRHLPGSVDVAQPGPHHRPPARRGRARPPPAGQAPGQGPRPPSCSSWSRSRTSTDGCGPTPTSCRGACASASMIAMALANDPDLLIADEPTTALDVTIQAQILDVLANVQRERHLAVVLVTHDLGVVAGLAQQVNVMYAGRLVEHGDAVGVFHHQNHPYTRGLLACLPRLDKRHDLVPIGGAPPSLDDLPAGCAFHPRCPLAIDRCRTEMPEIREFRRTSAACHVAPLEPAGAVRDGSRRPPPTRRRGRMTLLDVQHLVKTFAMRGQFLRRSTGVVQAVSDVSFHVDRGETLSLVGESGCGKSTTARCVLRHRRARLRLGGLRRHGARRSARRGAAQDAPPLPDGVPGSAGVAQPADDRRRAAGRAAAGPRPGVVRAPNASPSCWSSCSCRPTPVALPAPVLGRAAPAHRRGQGAGRRPGPARARRAGVGARRQHPGRDHPAPRAAAGRPRPRVPVHRPRPVRRPPHQRPRRGDVPRADRRDRARPSRSTAPRPTRTRRRCCRRRRSPTR